MATMTKSDLKHSESVMSIYKKFPYNTWCLYNFQNAKQEEIVIVKDIVVKGDYSIFGHTVGKYDVWITVLSLNRKDEGRSSVHPSLLKKIDPVGYLMKDFKLMDHSIQITKSQTPDQAMHFESSGLYFNLQKDGKLHESCAISNLSDLAPKLPAVKRVLDQAYSEFSHNLKIIEKLTNIKVLEAAKIDK